MCHCNRRLLYRPPAYSDAGYSDIPATVTVLGSIKGSSYNEMPGYSDIPLNVFPLISGGNVTVILSCHCKRGGLYHLSSLVKQYEVKYEQ